MRLSCGITAGEPHENNFPHDDTQKSAVQRRVSCSAHWRNAGRTADVAGGWIGSVGETDYAMPGSFSPEARKAFSDYFTRGAFLSQLDRQACLVVPPPARREC